MTPEKYRQIRVEVLGLTQKKLAEKLGEKRNAVACREATGKTRRRITERAEKQLLNLVQVLTTSCVKPKNNLD